MEITKTKDKSTITVNHWKFKFEKAIKVLVDNGHRPEDLIENLKLIVQKHYESKQN